MRTKEEALEMASLLTAGVSKKDVCARYGLAWTTVYKDMNLYGVYPFAMRLVSVVQLRALHDQYMDGRDVYTLAKSVGMTKSALRSRWKRLDLPTRKKPNVYPERKLAWDIGLKIWTMRSKGATTEAICKAIGFTFDPLKSANKVRHHLKRWCYDTHTKVPTMRMAKGVRKVVWLPPPTKPPT